MGASCHLAIHAQEAFSVIHQACQGPTLEPALCKAFYGLLRVTISLQQLQPEQNQSHCLCWVCPWKAPLAPIVLSASVFCGLDEVYKHCLSETQGQPGFVKLSLLMTVTACLPARWRQQVSCQTNLLLRVILR